MNLSLKEIVYIFCSVNSIIAVLLFKFVSNNNKMVLIFIFLICITVGIVIFGIDFRDKRRHQEITEKISKEVDAICKKFSTEDFKNEIANKNLLNKQINSLINLFEKGNKFVRQKRPLEALSQFEEALKIYPTVSALNNAANILSDLNEIDKALDYYNKAIKLDPNNPMPYYNIGNIYIKQKNFELAEEYYKLSIAKNETFCPGHFNLGKLYENLSQHDNAVIEYNRVIELNPNIYDPYMNIGNCYYKLGRYSNAIRALSKAKLLARNQIELFNALKSLGSSYYKNNQNKEALDIYQEALKICSNDLFISSQIKKIITNLQSERPEK